MSFKKIDKKGLNACWVEEALPEGRLSVHISEVGPGQRAHPPHAHEGVEAFYLIEGQATFEIARERLSLSPNEAVVFDPRQEHGLFNSGDRTMRYMVIIAR